MKNKYLFSLLLAVLLIGTGVVWFSEESPKASEVITDQHERHAYFLDNSPFKESNALTKAERKAQGLPPNAYNEQLWELTMDPALGYPVPERTYETLENLRKARFAQTQTRGVGGDANNPWVSRGPNFIDWYFGMDHGGRTRGVMFDPNDVDGTRVFAGSVSGGLWVNEDITDANSSWSLVSGLAGNLAVNVITHDPNDTQTFYVGTGESYTRGAGIGNGIYKSTDGGATWSRVFGQDFGTPSSIQTIDGVFFVNDIVARGVGSTTELYAAVAGVGISSRYTGTQSQFLGLFEQGLYKSTDNGANWTQVSITESTSNGSRQINPCDLELDINNNIWLTTTFNYFGSNGGKIYRSSDGVSFSLEHTLTDVTRTELECSNLDANKFWIAASDLNGRANLFITTNAFTNVTAMAEPDDADDGISSTDFTRGQAGYDLPIEADANDVLYVGGINLHRTFNDGTNWEQISKWANNASMNSLNVSFVHADIHSITFKPGSTSTAVISSDGGVHYTGSMGSAGFSAVIEDRNLGYNTIQFYYGAIGSNPAADDLLGGTQDNGTPVRFSALPGEGSYIERYTGDGAYTEIDVEDGYIIQSYTFNDHNIDVSPYNFSDYQVSDYDSNNPKGQFINVAELDSNLDILYYDKSQGGTYELESASNLLGGSSASIVYQTLSNAVMNQQPSAMKVSPHTLASTTLLVGLKNGRVIKITGANTVTPAWSNLTASVGGSFLGSVSDVEFGANDDEIYVTLYNYGIDNVWYTNDGGATWQNKEGDLPDIPVRSILRNPLRPQEVIIGTQIGVWATSDFTQANPTWVQTNNGMSEVAVVDLDLRAADNVILASTHGRGQFTSQFTSQALALDEANIVASNIKLVPSVTRDGAFGLLASQSYGTTSVKIFNMSGQQLYATDIELSRQRSTIQTNLSTGMYLVVLEHPDFRGTKRLIVQ